MLYAEQSPPSRPSRWLSDRPSKGQEATTCQARRVFSNPHAFEGDRTQVVVSRSSFDKKCRSRMYDVQ